MDKATATKIIEETFNSAFDKERFVHFLRNLLNTIKETPESVWQGNRVPDAYKQYIERFEKIGTYKDFDSNHIDILVVYLRGETSLERAHTRQRNLIAWYLGKDSKTSAALVAFVAPNGEDWRFSLVKMDYTIARTETGRIKAEKELTPARRWSFLVGEHENSHTAQKQLFPILEDDVSNPSLTDLEEAFNIEVVTKEFFEKYRELFNMLVDELDKLADKDKAIKAEFKKGTYLYDQENISDKEKYEKFVANFAKKLLGQIVFLYFLQKKGWFGVGLKDNWGSGPKDFLRELFKGKHGDYTNFFDEILEPLFYEALAKERDKDYYSRFKCRIPFLNGGLFDPIGNYDWVNTKIQLPNELFSNTEKTKQGDKGTGILDVFDRYNFTVKEDEPLEKDVAVDPEMLGKVFENLLEVKDRKSKGTYYTPREIVHYMCQESLTAYLATELERKVSKEDVETLIKYGESFVEHDARVAENGKETATYSYKLPESIRKNAKLIDEKLEEIRVCDPAVGSGAFLVGMMSEIVRTRNALTLHLKKDKKTRTMYNFKRHAIQNSLYGVDIDAGAVEICKLRLWLSLIVDESEYKEIQPLPNLDYKVVAGNSLLSVQKDDDSGTSSWTYKKDKEELIKLKQKYFDETSAKKKEEHKKQIDDLIGKITNGHKEFDFEVYFSEVFQEQDGFDVVIANPPYVEHKKLKNVSGLLRRFKVYSGTADLYVYFYEVALNILRETGLLTFISSNKFIRARYGFQLRELLSKNRIYNIVDFTNVKVFDALVASCIILVSKTDPSEDIIVTFADDTFTNSLADYIAENYIKVPANSLDSEIWQLEDKVKLEIKQRIEENTGVLESVDGIKIFRGITTGYNPAFIIDENTKNKLVTKDPKSQEVIKPLLQGRNIRRWSYKKSDYYLLQTGFDRDIKSELPQIFAHLSQHETKLKKRDDQGKNWWNLRACKYYNEFEKEKIIWGLTANKWAFAYDNKGHYLPSNGYILTSSSLSIKLLLALINSKLVQFYFGFIGIMTAGGAYTLKYETIAKFPVKEMSEPKQKAFIDLVDKILAITKDDDYSENSAKQAKVRDHEKQINQLVYKLYGLTPEEVKIVEAAKG